jgi:hypothetical protein
MFAQNASIRRGVNLHPIAGGQQQHLVAAPIVQQCFRSSMTQETFARFNGRSSMIQAKTKKVHAR